MKTRFLAILLVAALCIGLMIPAMAVTNNEDVYSALTYEGKQLTWENEDGCDLLVSVRETDNNITYEYDANRNRSKKVVGETVTTFEYDNDGNLLQENRGGLEFTYLYELDENAEKSMSGFLLNGQAYGFVRDDLNVVAIENAEGEVVARYQYDNGISVALIPDENGEWGICEDLNSIAALNLIRYNGYYLDEETGWYYCGRFYDAHSSCFIDGINEYGLDDIVLYDLSSDVERQAERLLKQSTYGKSIEYSTSWWTGLSETELIARTIYGENTKYLMDQNAIGRCLLNRYNDKTGYPNDMTEIITAKSQFAAITASSNETANARKPTTTSTGWANATYLACAIVLSKYSESDYISLCGDVEYFNTQTQFLGYSYFMLDSVTRDGTGCIQLKSGSKWVNLKNVIIPGIGKYTNKAALKKAYEANFTGSSATNIHFDKY